MLAWASAVPGGGGHPGRAGAWLDVLQRHGGETSVGCLVATTLWVPAHSLLTGGAHTPGRCSTRTWQACRSDTTVDAPVPRGTGWPGSNPGIPTPVRRSASGQMQAVHKRRGDPQELGNPAEFDDRAWSGLRCRFAPRSLPLRPSHLGRSLPPCSADWRLAKGSSVLSELGQAAEQVQTPGVILAVAALTKALYLLQPVAGPPRAYARLGTGRSTSTEASTGQGSGDPGQQQGCPVRAPR